MNKPLGLIEKKYNKKYITKIYHTMKEAQYYQIKYGVYIYKVSDTFYVDDEISQQEIDEGISARQTVTRNELCVLVNKVQKDLEETFNHMKDFIYDLPLFKRCRLHKTLTEKDIKVHGIKTDCLLVKDKKEELEKYYCLLKK